MPQVGVAEGAESRIVVQIGFCARPVMREIPRSPANGYAQDSLVQKTKLHPTERARATEDPLLRWRRVGITES